MLSRRLFGKARSFYRLPSRNISLLVNSQGLDDEQQMIQEMAYKFAEDSLEPKAAEWDKTKEFPVKVF
jgi:hypothetical protein